MPPKFQPLCCNPHLLTIAANFWPRRIDERRFPAKRREYRVDDRTTVVVYEHQPEGPVRGHIVLLHGLEGSAHAGYIVSLAQEALIRGFVVHRANLRTCGGTEELCETMYHSGLTSDTRFMLEQFRNSGAGPVFLAGFSLGGNVALKLAGELGHTDLLSGVCAVSTPIDLAAAVKTLDKRTNVLYARRFLDRLRSRVERKSNLAPHLYNSDGLASVKTIWEFDDLFTAPLFGFGTAANYYATQSAARFLHAIRVSALLVTSKDDPLVPFEMYDHPAFAANPALQLLAVEHGGHLGFLSRRRPRFWLDGVVLDWIEDILTADTVPGTNVQAVASSY
ncbi:MAG: alpha/beta fold hydrolase [Acidobacteriaceae bacterium]|nr:alpha/beta fold hydrolase [Acidobacteriaceae bacterium]